MTVDTLFICKTWYEEWHSCYLKHIDWIIFLVIFPLSLPLMPTTKAQAVKYLTKRLSCIFRRKQCRIKKKRFLYHMSFVKADTKAQRHKSILILLLVLLLFIMCLPGLHLCTQMRCCLSWSWEAHYSVVILTHLLPLCFYYLSGLRSS